MTRPRRPVLAAVCAVLLLATVGLWMRQVWYLDELEAVTETHRFFLDSVKGGLSFRWPVNSGGMTGFYGESSESLESPAVWWFQRGPDEVVAPTWLMVLFPALGLWWFWRGRKAGMGFPVEAKAGEGNAERTSS